MSRVVKKREAGVKPTNTAKPKTALARSKTDRTRAAVGTKRRSTETRAVNAHGAKAKTADTSATNLGKATRKIVKADSKRSAISSPKPRKAPGTKAPTKAEVQAQLTQRISQHQRSKETAKRYSDELRDANRTIGLLRKEVDKADERYAHLHQRMSGAAAKHADDLTRYKERIRAATEAKLKAQGGALEQTSLVAQRRAQEEEEERIEKLKAAVIKWQGRATELQAELDSRKRESKE